MRIEKSALDSKQSFIVNLGLPMLLFGSIGAIAWAIRGTAGWGGIDGTVLPGLMWGILWYYLSYRRGIDARGVVLWLGLGLALGGELGYGQYVSWIKGDFYVGDEIMPLAPRWGYAWLIMCGIGKAALGGIILGWALGKRVSARTWIIRSVMVVVLLVVMFGWPLIDWLGGHLVQIDPGILFPYSDSGIYSSGLDKHLSRTVYTNTQNFLAVVWWVGALLVAAWQRDRTTLITGLIIGGGFGLGLMQGAMWNLGRVSAPEFIDWWKMWELNAGFNLGLLYAITWYWTTRRAEKAELVGSKITEIKETGSKYPEWRDTMFLASGGFLLLFLVGFEYFFWTGLALSLFYFITMSLTTTGDLDSYQISERRKNVSLVYSIFLLVFLLFHGGSNRLGIILELYQEDAVSQYAWPIERIALFAPVALIITGVAIFKMWQILRPEARQDQMNHIFSGKSLRIIDLMTVMGFIGVLSIWPYKIGVLYAINLCFAIWAFNRLNDYYRKSRE
jgi:hypothetical protein